MSLSSSSPSKPLDISITATYTESESATAQYTAEHKKIESILLEGPNHTESNWKFHSTQQEIDIYTKNISIENNVSVVAAMGIGKVTRQIISLSKTRIYIELSNFF